MADAVTTQTLVDGPRNVVMKFTNVSDGTGESAVTKVTASSLSGSPTSVRIDAIEFSTDGMGVNILWDATTPVLAYTLPQNYADRVSFWESGGLINTKASGWTGNIKFTTTAHSAGDRYTVTLFMVKKY